jgi:hypothetical protein
MRSAGAKLFKGQRLPRLGRKTGPRLRGGKPMIQAGAQGPRRNRKHDRTVARCTPLLELPPTTCHVLSILFNLGTLCVVAHEPGPREPLRRGAQHAMVPCRLLPVPRAPHTDIAGPLTRLPPRRNAFGTGEVLVVAGGMELPRPGSLGQLHRFFLRQSSLATAPAQPRYAVAGEP